MLATLLSAVLAAIAAGVVVFESRTAGVRGDDVVAVAFDPPTGRVAIGDEGGVLLGEAEGSFRRVLRRGPVRDLAFLPESLDPERGLLAATAQGLFRIGPRAEVETVEVAAGELARAAGRLAAASGAVAVLTDAGVFVSGDLRRWSRLGGSLPSDAASDVALRRANAALECTVAFGRELWRVALRPDAAGFRVLGASSERLPISTSEGDPADLHLDVPGADTLVLYPRAIALRAAPDAPWQVLRPALPPGAKASRLLFARGRAWLGTDRGLLEASSLAGPWRRAALPAGAAAVRALAGDGETLLAGTTRGLLVAEAARAAPPAASRFHRASEPAGDPDVRRVHRAALAYLSLRPRRFEDLRRGLARRGWLPVLSFQAGMDRDEGRSIDFDEIFSSGATRRLTDRDRDRSDQLELQLTLSWDLGETVYSPEAVDLSREARLVIQLRDDVLDEITQLYFERRRVLVAWARLADRGTPEAELLRLRAEELAAGLDAWTGGWFSRHAAPLPP